MEAKEVISLLLEDLELSPNEFAAAIRASTSVVHNLVTGVTKKITSGTARKINDAFPQYSYIDLVSMVNPVQNKTESISTNSDITDIAIKKLAIKSIENWEELKRVSVFEKYLLSEVNNTLLYFHENPEAKKQWLEKRTLIK